MVRFDLQQAKLSNSMVSQIYNNGGIGRMPVVLEDQKTTEQTIARRKEYPTLAVTNYFTDTKNSEFYDAARNRIKTTAAQLSTIQAKGINVIGRDAYGNYDVIPKNENLDYIYAQQNSQTSTLLFALFAVGATILIINAIAPPPVAY